MVRYQRHFSKMLQPLWDQLECPSPLPEPSFMRDFVYACENCSTEGRLEHIASKISGTAIMQASVGICVPARPSGFPFAIPLLMVKADHRFENFDGGWCLECCQFYSDLDYTQPNRDLTFVPIANSRSVRFPCLRRRCSRLPILLISLNVVSIRYRALFTH